MAQKCADCGEELDHTCGGDVRCTSCEPCLCCRDANLEDAEDCDRCGEPADDCLCHEDSAYDGDI